VFVWATHAWQWVKHWSYIHLSLENIAFCYHFLCCHRIVESGEACPMCSKAIQMDQLMTVSDVKPYLYQQQGDDWIWEHWLHLLPPLTEYWTIQNTLALFASVLYCRTSSVAMDFMSKMWWTYSFCTRRLYQAPETYTVSTLTVHSFCLLYFFLLVTFTVWE